MAQKFTLVDDVTGEESATTRFFSIGEDQYEIDLVDSTYEDLLKAMAGFIESARKVTRGKKAPKAHPMPTPAAARSHKTSSGRAEQLSAIRAWARSQGMRVSDRGRLPEDIVDAFESAHKTKPSLFSATGA